MDKKFIMDMAFDRNIVVPEKRLVEMEEKFKDDIGVLVLIDIKRRNAYNYTLSNVFTKTALGIIEIDRAFRSNMYETDDFIRLVDEVLNDLTSEPCHRLFKMRLASVFTQVKARFPVLFFESTSEEKFMDLVRDLGEDWIQVDDSSVLVRFIDSMTPARKFFLLSKMPIDSKHISAIKPELLQRWFQCVDFGEMCDYDPDVFQEAYLVIHTTMCQNGGIGESLKKFPKMIAMVQYALESIAEFNDWSYLSVTALLDMYYQITVKYKYTIRLNRTTVSELYNAFASLAEEALVDGPFNLQESDFQLQTEENVRQSFLHLLCVISSMPDFVFLERSEQKLKGRIVAGAGAKPEETQP